MRDILLLSFIQAVVFLLCWRLLPYRHDHAAWFHEKFYRRGHVVVFGLAFACSFWPVVFTIGHGYGWAALVLFLGVAPCLTISLLWRPRYQPLTVGAVAAKVIASYLWPVSFVVALCDSARRQLEARG